MSSIEGSSVQGWISISQDTITSWSLFTTLHYMMSMWSTFNYLSQLSLWSHGILVSNPIRMWERKPFVTWAPISTRTPKMNAKSLSTAKYPPSLQYCYASLKILLMTLLWMAPPKIWFSRIKTFLFIYSMMLTPLKTVFSILLSTRLRKDMREEFLLISDSITLTIGLMMPLITMKDSISLRLLKTSLSLGITQYHLSLLTRDSTSKCS